MTAFNQRSNNQLYLPVLELTNQDQVELEYNKMNVPQQPAQLAISIVVPAYNEENGVAAQIEAIRQVLESHHITHEIIVVDDGSKDKTAEKAYEAGARVLQHSKNRGYGAALKSGIVAATYDTIIIIDADGTYPPDQIPILVAKLKTADMAVGARTGSHVQIPWQRRPAKWLLRWLATYIAEQPIPDLNSGLRAFRRECIKQYFLILSNRFSFTTTSTLAYLSDNYRVVYHPIDYYKRIGQSKIVPRHFLDFTILVLRMSMIFQPLKVFVPIALFFGLLGGLKVVYDIVTLFLRHPALEWSLLYQPTISASSMLLLLVGFQLLLIGMVADGIVRRISWHNGPRAPSHGVWGTELRPKQDKAIMK